MIAILKAVVAASLLFVPKVLADSSNIKCDPNNLCPESSPCCSRRFVANCLNSFANFSKKEYGQCGVGAYCLGGCDPVSSHSLDSCMPAPICSSKDVKFNSMNGMTEDTQYLGNTSSTDWVYSGIPKQYQDGNDQVVLMTLPQASAGTLIASAEYVWYGKISATMKTSRTQGVVTAFILLSDVKDEIDFEFVGYNTSQAQSNFYWQGVTNCKLSESSEKANTKTC
jgi:beta-glucanase (GH16 family)